MSFSLSVRHPDRRRDPRYLFIHSFDEHDDDFLIYGGKRKKEETVVETKDESLIKSKRLISLPTSRNSIRGNVAGEF